MEKLRDNWQEVVDLAERCRVRLLKERRGAFEQELDKQVKVSSLYTIKTLFCWFVFISVNQ